MNQDTRAWAAGASFGIEKVANSVSQIMKRNIGTSTRAVAGDRVLGQAQRRAAAKPKVTNPAQPATPLAQPSQVPDVQPSTRIG